MTQKEIYDLENANNNKIYLYREGIFWKAYERSALIEQARLGITRVKIEIRLLHDLKQLSVKQYAVLSQMSESVSKQLAAWSKSQKNKVKPNSD